MKTKKTNAHKREARKALPIGRSTGYSDELANFICEHIANSSDGLHQLYKKVSGFPSPTMIFKWLGKYPYFQDKYARARILQADFMAQQIIEISDTQVLAITKTTHEDGSFEITESDALGHRRLQVDARKWAASKLAPKKYGDKLDVTSEGEKIGKTIIINP